MTDCKPILCLDFDGVLHSYSSGWKGADKIPDPPVSGAMAFLVNAIEHFEVHVFSSRSNQNGGREAMMGWLAQHLIEHCGDDNTDGDMVLLALQFPTEKPPAQISIDDRAITFTGEWPDMDTLKNFKPWNSRNATS